LHFIPTSSSWLNLVERFFAEITGKRIRRRGVFKTVAELEAAIHDYLAKNNASPKPFVWTKTADIILEKNKRHCLGFPSLELRWGRNGCLPLWRTSVLIGNDAAYRSAMIITPPAGLWPT
jgi:hypothetical protein